MEKKGSDMNVAMLVGRVGRDPEMRGEGDKRWANFPVATNKWSKDGQAVTWHNIKVFDSKLAEVVEKRIQKGTLVSLVGENDVSAYKKNGEKKMSLSIIVPRFNGKIDVLADWKETQSSGSDQGSGDDDGIPF